MGKRNIERFSAGYALLKMVARFWHNHLFYRKVIVKGRENIDYSRHNIFAPNHQNALMDAMAVICTTRGQMVFLARSDIFRKRVIASLLYFLKILPVYRIKDGYDTLRLNDEIFRKTIDVIENKNGIGILPEGNHHGERRLRTLKKGICRIAFSAEEISGGTLDMQIVPVGLDYSDYSGFREVLTVIYGEPISISGLTELYRRNPAKALNELRDKIADALKGVMVHIDAGDDYEAINEFTKIVNVPYQEEIEYTRLERDRDLVNNLNNLKESDSPLYRKICDMSEEAAKIAGDIGVDYEVVRNKASGVMSLIARSAALFITSPLFLVGAILNYPFYRLSELPLKKIADRQFHSSVQYVVSLFTAIVVTPLLAIPLLILVEPWWLGLIIFVSVPLTGIAAWNWKRVFMFTRGLVRRYRYIRQKESRYARLEEIVGILDRVAESIRKEGRG